MNLVSILRFILSNRLILSRLPNQGNLGYFAVSTPSSHGFFLCSSPWSYISLDFAVLSYLDSRVVWSLGALSPLWHSLIDRFIIINKSVTPTTAGSSTFPSDIQLYGHPPLETSPIYQFALSTIICTFTKFTKNYLPILGLSQELSVQHPLKLLWRFDIVIIPENL